MPGDNNGTPDLRNLYFECSNGDILQLADSIEEKDVSLVIRDFLKKHNYKSYYTRSWEKNGVKKYDVGSHTQFFLWASEEDVMRYIK